MRLLYVGQLWEGGTAGDRMRTLAQLGMEIVPFDVTGFMQRGSRIAQSWASRTLTGPGIQDLNRKLAQAAKTEYFDVVWVDKGTWIFPDTIELLRSAAHRRFAVHYTPDAQLVDNKSRHFESSIALYDLLVTTKKFELDLYQRHGARELLLVLQGYGSRHTPMSAMADDERQLGSDVCFIGHAQRHYAGRLKAVCQRAEVVKVWGPGWSRYARVHPWARPIVQGDGIWAARYPLALSCTKVALGLLSKRIPETTTTRTFEIPATGVFMLAERNEDHLALFEEGKEAEFFTSDEELRDKTDFYVRNSGPRARIASAGRDRCIRSGYSDAHQLMCVTGRLPASMMEPS